MDNPSSWTNMANSDNDYLYMDGLFSQFDVLPSKTKVLPSPVATSTYGARSKTKSKKVLKRRMD